MFSEVCIPLTTRCLHAPLLYIGGAYSLARSHQPWLWCGHHRVLEGTRAVAFGRKLDSEDGGEHLGEACRKARRRPTCAWGRPEAIHGVTRPGAWPLRGIPCEGLQRGLGEACVLLDTSVKIPELSMGVCVSLPYSLASAFTLFA